MLLARSLTMRSSPYSSAVSDIASDTPSLNTMSQSPFASVDRLLVVRRAFEQADDRPAAFEPPHGQPAGGRHDERRIVPGVAVGQPAVRPQRAVHQRHEPRLDAAPVERQVDAAIVCDGESLVAACAAKIPCIIALRSAAGGPLPATSPSAKPSAPVGRST